MFFTESIIEPLWCTATVKTGSTNYFLTPPNDASLHSRLTIPTIPISTFRPPIRVIHPVTLDFISWHFRHCAKLKEDQLLPNVDLIPFFPIRLLPPTFFLRECHIITRVIYPNFVIICKWIAITNCYAFANMLCNRIRLHVNTYRWDEVIYLKMNPLGNLSTRIIPMSVWFNDTLWPLFHFDLGDRDVALGCS